MPWVKLDDQFAHHETVEKLKLDAIGLHTLALREAIRAAPDSVVPRPVMARHAEQRGCDLEEIAALLVRAGYWAEAGDGWRLVNEHDLWKIQRFTARTYTEEVRKALGSIRHCAWCGGLGTYRKGPDDRSWHIDHVLPVSKGGGNNPSNLVRSCATCNMSKGNKEWTLPDDVYTAQDLIDAGAKQRFGGER